MPCVACFSKIGAEFCKGSEKTMADFGQNMTKQEGWMRQTFIQFV